MVKLNNAEKCLMENIEHFKEKYRSVILAVKSGVLLATDILSQEMPEEVSFFINRFDELITLVNELEFKEGNTFYGEGLFVCWTTMKIDNEYSSTVNTRIAFDKSASAFDEFQSTVTKQLELIESVEADVVRVNFRWISENIRSDLKKIIKEYRNS